MPSRLNSYDLWVLIWGLGYLVWKRRKDLLYLGSFHSCELPEFYGFTGDHVGTDALSMYTFLPPLPVLVADEDYTSQLRQPSKPQPPEGFQRHQSTVKYHLAEIHP